jgi:hypothetical protein
MPNGFVLVGYCQKIDSAPAKSGPKADNEGHRCIADLLVNKPEWVSNLEATCELLASPPDGKPGPKPSLFWRKKYNVSTYADAFRLIPWAGVYRNIERRIYLGKCLNGTIEHRATRPKRLGSIGRAIRKMWG